MHLCVPPAAQAVLRLSGDVGVPGCHFLSRSCPHHHLDRLLVAQVVLRWVLQQGGVVLPRSTSPGHMRENLDLFGFELGFEDFARISTMAKN